MEENIKLSPEQAREIGKAYFFANDSDAEKRSAGLKLLLQAASGNDPEAQFVISRLLLDGVLKSLETDSEEHALRLMCSAANNGCIQARAFLNAYCEQRYDKEFDERPQIVSEKGLVDFDGRPIKINRQGIFTPIDALLEFKDGKNILTLSTNILFFYGEEIAASKEFEQAVLSGIMEWQGDYEVFGGQKLTVKLQLTRDNNIFDNLIIMPLTDKIGSDVKKISDKLATKNKKEQIMDALSNKRSFAAAGVKWSVNSRKVIFIQSESGLFDDYEEIKNVAKHEFGHTIGLGDLYASAIDTLPGVEKGTYTELDCYAIRDKYYNLVMCDHHGPVSNNDIEMVVLAFRDNKMQLYQPGKLKGIISSALGKGN